MFKYTKLNVLIQIVAKLYWCQIVPVPYCPFLTLGAKLPVLTLGAKLFGAKLSGAKLSGAKLSGAKLSGDKLFGAKLSHNLYISSKCDIVSIFRYRK